MYIPRNKYFSISDTLYDLKRKEIFFPIAVFRLLEVNENVIIFPSFVRDVET